MAISFPGAHPMAHGVFSRRGARGASHSDAEGCDGRDGTLDHQSISSLWRAKSVVTVWGRSWRSHSSIAPHRRAPFPSSGMVKRRPRRRSYGGRDGTRDYQSSSLYGRAESVHSRCAESSAAPRMNDVARAQASSPSMPPEPVPSPKFFVQGPLSRTAAAIRVLNSRLFVTPPAST